VEALLLDEEERHAREREVMLATALTTLDHPVFILEQGVIRYANPASARQYGWTALELVGRTLSALVVDAAEGSTDGNPTPSSAEQVHRRADGSEFSAVLSVSPLRTDAGVVHGSVVSVRDVSHDRAVAEQLRHSEKMVALGELVAGVAHEINNPLTSISAFAELLLEDALTAEQLESVKLIKQESDRATSVIRDLLLFARKGDAATGPIDINQLVDQTLRVRTFVLRNAQIDLEVLLDTARPIVQGDAHRLQQVLLNLLTNAEHALRGRTLRRLTVSTRLTAGRVEVCVADTGHGMSPLVRRRLFEPFFTTKPPGAGTGLGLSMSYGIAQAHHGTLEVHSDEGVGTTVTLILPAASHPDFSAIT
jgi:two-component system NtrC family sensor kinase